MCVEIHTERERRAVVLFVAPGSAPEDLFEESPPFFPADEDGTVRLFARSSMSLSGHSRTLDLLNQPAKSFAVHTNGKVHHVAKAFVLRIEELR